MEIGKKTRRKAAQTTDIAGQLANVHIRLYRQPQLQVPEERLEGIRLGFLGHGAGRSGLSHRFCGQEFRR